MIISVRCPPQKQQPSPCFRQDYVIEPFSDKWQRTLWDGDFFADPSFCVDKCDFFLQLPPCKGRNSVRCESKNSQCCNVEKDTVQIASAENVVGFLWIYMELQLAKPK